MKHRSIVLLIVVLCAHKATSQKTGEDALGSWWMLFANHRISDDLSIHSEVQYRTYEFGSNFNQMLIRTGLTYHFAESSSVTFGYGNIPTDNTFEDIAGEKKQKEHRIYQEFSSNQQLGAFVLSHRYRLEQRFLEDPVGNSSTQHRMRYGLRITYPLTEKWFLTAYDELFINLQKPTFGQNRLYGAFGYKINSKTNLQLGYLKNHIGERAFDRFQLGISLSFDYRKKDKPES